MRAPSTPRTLVASEPATAAGSARVRWLTLPANAMLVYSRGGGVPTLAQIQLPPGAVRGAGAAGEGSGAGAISGAGVGAGAGAGERVASPPS